MPLAEFAGVWASNQWIFPESGAVDPFRGLQPEESWNLGLNLLSGFGIPRREFQPRWLPRRLQQSGLRGPRYARCGDHPPRNEPVAERSGRILVGLNEAVDVTLAYRWVDASSDYGDFSGYRQARLWHSIGASRQWPTARVRTPRPTVARGCDVPGHRRSVCRGPSRTTSSTPLCPAPEAPTFVTGNVQISDLPKGTRFMWVSRT